MCHDMYHALLLVYYTSNPDTLCIYYLKYNILEYNNIILNNIFVDFIKTISRTNSYRRDHSSLRILWQGIQFKIDT